MQLSLLRLQGNKLVGPLPQSWSDLANVGHRWFADSCCCCYMILYRLVHTKQLTVWHISKAQLRHLSVLLATQSEHAWDCRYDSQSMLLSWTLLSMQLTYMDMSVNLFSGTLPSAWVALTQVNHVVWLNYTLPSCMHVLLRLCLLANICLSYVTVGTILLMQLLALDLHHNMLTGTLPESWSSVTNVSCWHCDCMFAYTWCRYHCKCQD